MAGELSDLLEGTLPEGVPTPPLEEANQGGKQALTPGATADTKVKEENLSPQSLCSYSEEGEEEEPVDDKPLEEASTEKKKEAPAAPVGGQKADHKEGTKEEREEKDFTRKSPPRKLHPNFRPDYLTRRLGLAPCGKASASKDRSVRSPKSSLGAEASTRHGGETKRERSPTLRGYR